MLTDVLKLNSRVPDDFLGLDRIPPPLMIAGLVLAFLFLVLLQQRRNGERLKEESAKRSMMVGLLSHRLRTPLGSVRWYSEMLLGEEFGKLLPEQKELIDKLNVSVADAISVLNTFLESSRFERGEFKGKPLKIDVWQEVMNVIESLRYDITHKNILVEVDHSFAHSYVECDPILLHTVLEVVLSNAIKYTQWQGHVWVSAHEKDGNLSIDVADSGLGISPEDQPHIFEKFFRTADARRVEPNGNGLGLSLSRDILTTIGGSIAFRSTKAQGSTFTVTIPKGGVRVGG